MNDLFEQIFNNFNSKVEIMDLWYEISFLRLVLNRILELNPSLGKSLTQECFAKARKQAHEIVCKKFDLDKESNPEKKQEQTSCTDPNPPK